jgi:hypothetical protein
MRGKKCAGFPKPCQETPGPTNPIWCDDCNNRRIDHISMEMDAIEAQAQRLEKRPARSPRTGKRQEVRRDETEKA